MHSSNHAQGIVHQNKSIVLYPRTRVPMCHVPRPMLAS